MDNKPYTRAFIFGKRAAIYLGIGGATAIVTAALAPLAAAYAAVEGIFLTI